MNVCQIINEFGPYKKNKIRTIFCARKMIFIIACSFCLFCLSSLPDEGFTLPNWPARRGEAKFSDTSKYSALSWAWICKLDQTIHYIIEKLTCYLIEWLNNWEFSDTLKYFPFIRAWLCKMDQTIHYLIEYKAQSNLGEWSKMYCHFNNINCPQFWRQEGKSRNVTKLFKSSTQFLDGLFVSLRFKAWGQR